MKKPFKDTKVGKLLTQKLPHVLDIVGQVLPDQGVLGVVKNIVHNSNELEPTDKTEIMREINRFEEEMYKETLKDRADARARQVAMADTDKSDWLMSVAGVTALGSFILMVIAIVFIPLKNEAIFHQVLGVVEGVALTIFAYYFGSARNQERKAREEKEGYIR